MEWFGWRLSKDPAADKATVFGPQTILQDLHKRVPQYLDDVDQGKLVYPACKRPRSDAHGDVRSIWDHTRLEAIRYVTMVPRREFELLAEPARQREMLEAYLRQRPHEDTVIEFTGSTMSDLAIAIVAGFNWLNHCAVLAAADRDKFTGTLNHFRKVTVLAQQWWAMEGADERCGQDGPGPRIDIAGPRLNHQQDAQEAGDHRGPSPPAYIFLEDQHGEHGQDQGRRKIDRGRDGKGNMKQRDQVDESRCGLEDTAQHDLRVGDASHPLP